MKASLSICEDFAAAVRRHLSSEGAPNKKGKPGARFCCRQETCRKTQDDVDVAPVVLPASRAYIIMPYADVSCVVLRLVL